MINIKEILKYKLLNQFTQKLSMYRICNLLFGLQFHAVWNLCDVYGKKFFGWNFLERRQLFLELVAYSLEQKNIKFGDEITFAEEPFIWDESTSIEDTIIYLEKGFSQNEEHFNNGTLIMPELFGNVKITSKEGYKRVIEYPSDNYEINAYIYFLDYCPRLAYWDKEYKSWEWVD